MLKISAITLIITLFLFEILAFTFDKFDIIIPEESRTSYFKKVRIVDPNLGWDLWKKNNSRRPNDQTYNNVCYATFGDAFTYSDKVPHNGSRAYLLSKKLNWLVDNLGVGGYGQD
ncbi:MAG: hypothetical protein VCE74_16870, partial [Alphaproteobacteria bacterium]